METHPTLPSLRRRIFRSFVAVVAIHGILGILLLLAVFTASRNTPKVIHRNYDSIASVMKMKEALDALRNPQDYADRSVADWKKQFSEALTFEENNVTEAGEDENVKAVSGWWKLHSDQVEKVSDADWKGVTDRLSQLVKINEQGMFGLASLNSRMARIVLAIGILFLLGTLVLSIFLADQISNRLSSPFRTLAEILRNKPKIGRKLKLPEPADLEVLILNQELMGLWDRVNEIESLNIQQIVQEKTRLEAVLEGVEDSLIVVDHSGRVTHCNRTLLELIGLNADQVMGSFWNDLPTLDEDYLKLREVLKETIRNGSEIELQLGESSRHYSARARKIVGSDGSTFGTLYLLHDISEKRQRDKLRNDIVDLLSHELKTPLQSLGTASDLLVRQRAKLPEELHLLVDTIAEDIRRINAVSHEFVQVSQSHSKVLKFRIDRVVLSDVLQDWLKPFRVVAQDRGVELVYQKETAHSVVAFVDSVKFPWVISNLVSNAIRFTPKGEKIVVRLSESDSQIEITVEDQGPGVPVAEQKKIFEPFYQSKVPTYDGTRGLFGVGLTIAKDVVEAHDGTLEFLTNQPKGSIFKIRLPRG
jgi:NtrC-family two-component system sensor histidine kinase KinB